MAVLIACKTLAQRIEFLERQTDELTAEIDTLTTALNPALRAAYGVGPDTAAQLLITAGTNAGRLRSEAAFAMLSRCRPHPGLLRQNHPPPAVPRRGPRRQQRPAPHRPGPLVPRSTHPRLRRPPTRRRPLQKRHPAPTQTSHRPRNVHTPHHALPDRRLQRPTPHPPSPKHHPHRRRATTSASGPPTSPDSNADSNATTPSPPTTANGSTPNSSTPLDP